MIDLPSGEEFRRRETSGRSCDGVGGPRRWNRRRGRRRPSTQERPHGIGQRCKLVLPQPRTTVRRPPIGRHRSRMAEPRMDLPRRLLGHIPGCPDGARRDAPPKTRRQTPGQPRAELPDRPVQLTRQSPRPHPRERQAPNCRTGANRAAKSGHRSRPPDLDRCAEIAFGETVWRRRRPIARAMGGRIVVHGLTAWRCAPHDIESPGAECGSARRHTRLFRALRAHAAFLSSHASTTRRGQSGGIVRPAR
jgi:hypothetical protein